MHQAKSGKDSDCYRAGVWRKTNLEANATLWRAQNSCTFCSKENSHIKCSKSHSRCHNSVFCSRTCDFRYHKKQTQLLHDLKWFQDVSDPNISVTKNEQSDSPEPDVRHKHHTYEGNTGDNR